MFGFGIILMHLADYFTRRKYDNKRRKEKEKEAKDKQITDAKKV
jgi:hypothetical protein